MVISNDHNVRIFNTTSISIVALQQLLLRSGRCFVCNFNRTWQRRMFHIHDTKRCWKHDDNNVSLKINSILKFNQKNTKKNCRSHFDLALLFSFHRGSYEVLNDDVDAYELAVKIAGFDNGESLYESLDGSQEGDFTLDRVKPSSKFSLCFQNNAEDDDEENEFDVGFNLRFDKQPTRTMDDEVEGPDGEKASQLIDKAAKIHQDWNILQDHFDFLRQRESIHFGMNQQIMNRLSKWTYIEIFLVISISVSQVLYWKKFFEKRRYL